MLVNMSEGYASSLHSAFTSRMSGEPYSKYLINTVKFFGFSSTFFTISSLEWSFLMQTEPLVSLFLRNIFEGQK